MSKSKKFLDRRHTFYFKDPITGEIRKERPKVRPGTAFITATLTEPMVLDSIKYDGRANGQCCPGAICIRSLADLFPHNCVKDIDFTHGRVWIGSKKDRNGRLTECYCYEHSSEIPKIADGRDGLGLYRILELIRENGPIEIHLRPFRERDKQSDRPSRERKVTGVRKKYLGRGAKLRYQTAFGGAEPAAAK